MVNKVPEGWKKTKFGSLAKLEKGYSYKSDDLVSDGVSFITIKCFSKDGGFSKRGIKSIRTGIDKEYSVQPGDLLISNTDLTRDGDIIGSPVQVPTYIPSNTIISMDVSRVKTNPNIIDSQFLFHHLCSFPARKYMQTRSAGSTVLHLKTKDVPKYTLLLPPLPEQKKIAAILSSVDEAIEATEAVIEQTRTVKKGLLQELLTRGIGYSEFKETPIGEIPKSNKVPEGWKETTLGHLFNMRGGNRPHIKGESMAVYPIIGSSGEIGYTSDYNIDSGFLVGRVGAVGTVRKVNTKCWASDNTLIFESKASSSLTDFLFHSLVNLNLEQFATTTAQPLLTQKNLRDIALLIPPLPEQKKIVAILSSVDEAMEAEEEKLSQLQQLKRGLLQDLLTGKVRVKTGEGARSEDGEELAEAMAE